MLYVYMYVHQVGDGVDELPRHTRCHRFPSAAKGDVTIINQREKNNFRFNYYKEKWIDFLHTHTYNYLTVFIFQNFLSRLYIQ